MELYTMNDIVYDGNPILRKKVNEVSFPLSDEIKLASKKMMNYLIVSQDDELNEKYNLRPGVGIAAPQVGLDLAMTAILLQDDEDGEIIFKDVIYNPKIVSESAKKAALESGEGCLSVENDIPGYVERANKITVRYQDANGNTKELKLKEYPGIVFQHEIDHLNGILYYDHINKFDPWMKKDNVNYIN